MNILDMKRKLLPLSGYMGGGGDSGGGGAQTSTSYNTNIPEYARPYVETMLGSAQQELFDYGPSEAQYEDVPIYAPKTGPYPGSGPGVQIGTERRLIPGTEGAMVPKGLKAYKPFNQDPSKYFAGPSDLQTGARLAAQNMGVTPETMQAAGYADAAGQGGLNSANQAYGYGNAGFQSGQQGQQMGMQGGQYYGDLSSQIGLMGLDAQQTGSDIGNQAQQYARQAANAQQRYAAQATNPAAYQQYMSPYMQNVVDVQNQAAQRNADIASTQRGAQFARAGAYGGSRQAIENAEANRALQTTMNVNQTQGLQNAYQDAQKNLQYGAGLGLQGLQGAQQGLGTALQGGQLGLSGIGAAMQGQQGALQGVNTQLAGTAQGMQGAGMGLQGVSGAQAGYGLANQAAGQLGQLGQNIYGQQVGNINLQNQMGSQQQQEQQAILNQQIQNYATAQQYPMMQLSNMSNLLRGMPMQSTTVQGYQAQPNALSQLGGLGLTGAAIANLGGKGNAKGGRIKEKKRPAGLAELALMKMQ